MRLEERKAVSFGGERVSSETHTEHRYNGQIGEHRSGHNPGGRYSYLEWRAVRLFLLAKIV